MSFFGKKLREALDAKGIKQADIGFDLRIEPALISAILAGRRKPNKILKKLSEYEPLGLSLLDLQSWVARDTFSIEVILKAAQGIQEEKG